MAYTLTGRKSGTVRFEPRSTGVVEMERDSYSSWVTSNPIEDGGEINDHVNNAAGTLSISGTIIGGDGAISALKAMRAKRELITYIGVTRMSNLVFTAATGKDRELRPHRDSHTDGEFVQRGEV